LNYNTIEVAQGEVVYIGDIHLENLTKPKKEQLKDAVRSGPLLAPILTVAAVVGATDEYLQIEITDEYEAAVQHFQLTNEIDATLFKNRIFKPVESLQQKE